MLEYSTSLQDSLAYILGKGERLSTADLLVLELVCSFSFTFGFYHYYYLLN